MNSSPEKLTVIYDGECGLCDRSVHFIRQHSTAGFFEYVPLSSVAAHRLWARDIDQDSVLLIENGTIYSASTAALRIARRLKLPWRWLSFFLLVPRPIRDGVYRWIARNRHRFFGRQTPTCRI